MEGNNGHCIIQIGDCIVSSEIVTEFFACDYAACRGACCIEGDGGAPLEEWEPEEIERNYEVFSPLMTQAGREAISKQGFFEIDFQGEMVTPLVERTSRPAVRSGSPSGAAVESPDSCGGTGNPYDRECAYTCFDEGGNCFCAIERKWFAGESSFRKPISCHLYPIRVSLLKSGMKALNLDRRDICRAAFEKGRRENVRVYEFLEEPIRLCFGSEFHTALKQLAEHLL